MDDAGGRPPSGGWRAKWHNAGGRYAVWRDGALLADGLLGDAMAVAGNRLILGDFSSSGISTSALLHHAAFDTSVAVAVVPEPGTSAAGLGAAGAIAVWLACIRNRLGYRSGCLANRCPA